MGIDVTRAPEDRDTGRPPADAPAEQPVVVPPVRAERQPQSAAEHVEAHHQVRLTADRAFARLIAEQIAAGHAFDKHVVEKGEFPGITTRKQFAALIESAVMSGESRVLSGGRTAYWSDSTVVIRDPSTADGGTTFHPKHGHDYFLGLH